MSRILELADAYAEASIGRYGVDTNPSKARAALAAEVEKLEEERDALQSNLDLVRDMHTARRVERDALHEKLAAVEKGERSNQKLLYGFMLDWNAIGPLDAAANLARGIKEAAIEATK